MAVDSRAVEQRSRLTVQDIEAALAFDSDDLPDSSVVAYWLTAGKQAADQYLNRDFARYDDIPEPVEQGVIAYVHEMLYSYLESIAIGGAIGEGDSSTVVGVKSIKVGDQSITYATASESRSQIAGSVYQRSGFGPANLAGQAFWSSYRYLPLL